MKHVLGKLLGKIFRGSSGTAEKNKRFIHLPDDLHDPDGFLVYSGPEESDVWPAIYIMNTLHREFPKKKLVVICSIRDSVLFNMLRLRPIVHSYEGRPKIPDMIEGDSISPGTILVHPYTSVLSVDEKVLSETPCRIRMAPLSQSSAFINFRVKTKADVYPDILAEMCSTIGLDYDSDWKPAVPNRIEELVEHKIAPVSGRMLPYIVTTPSAISILEKRRAEIPLRTVTLSGKNSDFDHLDREIKTVIIADATAVLTDSDDQWGDACAHGVPVVGLDRTGNFLKWKDIKPASNDDEFAESWVKLLKKGW
ncbi:MAG: hypothetical protein K8S24_06095 [Candidatus Aegiribacteria sp.]|nr:hypothetical protein [Candidatus Aegiribacteria sp.]